MRLKIILLFTLILLSLSISSSVPAFAEDSYDYDDIQDVIDSVEGSVDFNFEDYIDEKTSNEADFSFDGIFKYIGSFLFGALSDKINNIRVMLAIIIVAAIFRIFTSAFRYSQVADIGYYITYLFLFGIIGTSFISLSGITLECMDLILDFMKVLLPTYTAAVAFSTGTAASILLYEGTMLIITLCNSLLIRYILPLAKVYMMVMLIDCMRKETMLGKFGELIFTLVKWSLRTMTAIVVAITSIQGITVPGSSKLKHSLLYKVTNLIPVVGDALSNATETVIGVGSILKNAIGAAGITALVFIIAGPFLELVLSVLVYKSTAAIIQPVSDTRIVNCINYAAEAVLLLLRILTTCAVLFLIVIAIVALTF